MISALLKYQFLQNAMLAGLLSSIVCGIIGVIIIEKKLVMLSGGIAHTSYGGVGLGYLLGFEPILGAFLFAVGGALAIGRISRRKSTNSDVVIGLFWSFGMALGILFIALTPGYPPDITSYLFGNILSVTQSDILLMLCLTALVVIAVASFYDTWKAFLFDGEFAAVMGINTVRLNYILLVLVAMTVVVLIRVVGIILVLALLTAPAAVAGLLTNSFGKRIFLSILFGAVFCLAGLWISYTLNIASGACIVILSAVCYLIVYILRGRRRAAQHKVESRS
ncbi:MAG: metal ABC transporter permease [Oscillospiraceae bacterium]|jgi:zinc transport system permease protein|nr:metal ABC transporter permease [Oscillospiraceae bacterium]